MAGGARCGVRAGVGRCTAQAAGAWCNTRGVVAAHTCTEHHDGALRARRAHDRHVASQNLRDRPRPTAACSSVAAVLRHRASLSVAVHFPACPCSH